MFYLWRVSLQRRAEREVFKLRFQGTAMTWLFIYLHPNMSKATSSSVIVSPRPSTKRDTWIRWDTVRYRPVFHCHMRPLSQISYLTTNLKFAASTSVRAPDTSGHYPFYFFPCQLTLTCTSAASGSHVATDGCTPPRALMMVWDSLTQLLGS